MTPELLRQLEGGHLETATHVEQMALNMAALMVELFPDLKDRAQALEGGRFLARLRLGGALLWEAYGEDILEQAPTWPSDVARGWAAMAVGEMPDVPLAARFRRIRPFARDPHFAVREWSWLAVRSHIVDAPFDAVDLLTPWTGCKEASIRRFVVESTRPRSVWGRHITELRKEPWRGSGLLLPLTCDESAYVRRAVGNWLNDVAAEHGDWVWDFVESWGCDCPSTKRVRKAALRRIQDPSEVREF